MFIEPDAPRKFVRVHFDRYVNMEFISDSYDHCQIRNLSLNGMFVKGDFKQHKGKSCLIDLIRTGTPTELRLHALAKVARRDDRGIAVKFSSMPFYSYMYLQTSLLYEADNPLVLEKMLAEKCPFEITDELLVPPGEIQ